jgi:hypothetical protein
MLVVELEEHMGFLSEVKAMLFGSREDDARLEIASEYVRQNGNSGFVRHYEAFAVQECIHTHTGVDVSLNEAVELIQGYRKEQGWSLRSHESFFPPEEE